MNKVPKGKLACLVVNIFGLLCLFLKTILNQNLPLYDEPYHLSTVGLLNQYGFSLAFFGGTDESALGPVYAIIHYLLQPITNLEVPAVRLVNIALLFCIIIIIFFTFKELRSPTPWLSSVSIISIPMIWVISGMALTEIPAMFLASCGVYLLLIAINRSRKKSKTSLLLALFGGFLFSLSILGRQTFLVVLLALPLLLVSGWKKQWNYLLAFLMAGLILPLVQFYIWGGLIPSGITGDVTQGFSIKHGILSYAYAGAIMLILAPRWFSLDWKFNTIVFCCALVFNLISGLVEFTPAFSIAQQFIPSFLLPLYPRFASGILVALGVIFSISSLKNLWHYRQDRVFLFLCIAMLFVCATPGKIIHVFSSRYTATAIPFMVLVADRYTQNNYAKALRMTFSSILGFLSLNSYFP